MARSPRRDILEPHSVPSTAHESRRLGPGDAGQRLIDPTFLTEPDTGVAAKGASLADEVAQWREARNIGRPSATSQKLLADADQFDQDLGLAFFQIRQVLRLTAPAMARQLQCRSEVIDSLEAGAVHELPQDDELARLIAQYAALAGIPSDVLVARVARYRMNLPSFFIRGEHGARPQPQYDPYAVPQSNRAIAPIEYAADAAPSYVMEAPPSAWALARGHTQAQAYVNGPGQSPAGQVQIDLVANSVAPTALALHAQRSASYSAQPISTPTPPAHSAAVRTTLANAGVPFDISPPLAQASTSRPGAVPASEDYGLAYSSPQRVFDPPGTLALQPGAPTMQDVAAPNAFDPRALAFDPTFRSREANSRTTVQALRPQPVSAAAAGAANTSPQQVESIANASSVRLPTALQRVWTTVRQSSTTSKISASAIAMTLFVYLAGLWPQALYGVVGIMPETVRPGVRRLIDPVAYLLAPRRDGLIWIEVHDPRLRKADRLHAGQR